MSVTTANGWLYCITNPDYEKEGIYKCGFTTKGETRDEAEQKLRIRYGTTWLQVILHHIEPVSTPKQAEQTWFERMDAALVNKKKEFFQLPLVDIVRHMKEVALLYLPENRNWTELQKHKYMQSCEKVCKRLETQSCLQHFYSQLFAQYQRYDLENICTSFYQSKRTQMSRAKGYLWTSIQPYFIAALNGNEVDKEFIHVFSSTR